MQERNLEVARTWCLETGNTSLDSKPFGEVIGVRLTDMVYVWQPTQGTGEAAGLQWPPF